MKHRALDLSLLLVVLLGGILACHTGRQRSRLRGEYERLARITGDLPSRMHPRFMCGPWRPAKGCILPGASICLPTTNRFLWNSVRQSSRRHGAATPCEFIARVRFRENEQGVLQVYSEFLGRQRLYAISETGRWRSCCTITGTRSMSNSWGPKLLSLSNGISQRYSCD